MKRKRFLVLVLILALIGPLTSVVYASFNNEPFESENYYTYGGSKNGTFSLTYLNWGINVSGDKCDWNDRVFRVNVSSSYTGSDWKMYSNNTRYRRTPSGRVPYGHYLNTTSAHVCIGASEFSSSQYPNTYWSTSGAQSNVYTWRR